MTYFLQSFVRFHIYKTKNHQLTCSFGYILVPIGDVRRKVKVRHLAASNLITNPQNEFLSKRHPVHLALPRSTNSNFFKAFLLSSKTTRARSLTSGPCPHASRFQVQLPRTRSRPSTTYRRGPFFATSLPLPQPRPGFQQRVQSSYLLVQNSAKKVKFLP